MLKMMTAAEAIEELFEMERPRELAFTFDDINIDPECEPSGWYGMKMLRIFDEDDWVFAMGYYGGGSTEAYDIYGSVEDSYNTKSVKEFCAKKLQMYMNTWCDSSENLCEKICVEIKEVPYEQFED